MANPPGVPATLPKSVPAAPYNSNGKGVQWVEINGQKYYLFGKNGYSSADPPLQNWPVAAITNMAVWGYEAKKIDPNKYDSISLTACENWLNGKHTNGNISGVVAGYIQVTHPPPSTSAVPGSGAGGDVLSGLEGVYALLNKLGTSEFWIKAGEFIGGFILIAIGAHALVSDSLHPNSKHSLGSSTRALAKGVAKVAK